MSGMPAFDPAGLIRLQWNLECIGLTRHGRLTRIDGPDPDQIATAYLVLVPGGTLELFLCEDVSDSLAQQSLAMPLNALVEDPVPLAELLNAKHIERFSAYVFPSAIRQEHRSIAVLSGAHARAELLVEEGGLAYCESVRENSLAAEAWAFVPEGQRRLGHGSAVVLAWAQEVQSRGKTPFYSHKEENRSSAELAKSLGLVKFVDVVAWS